ncbi:MAG TPA: polysaccharide biosynthesis C-terminal domain-containing protein, partial [Polyangiaceae bacterium]|nr:polysaccharide biosynthesis C-terminal domain-containing protein [Polyangiaceae bacterium]
ATGDLGELRTLFLKWSKIAFSLSLAAGAYLLVLGPEFIGWWMGPSFAAPSGRVTRVLMAAFLLFLPARGVASPMLMGLGRAAFPSFAFLALGLLNVALSVALVKPFGIVGVALGTAIPGVLFSLAVAWFACLAANVRVGEYVQYVLVRPTLGAVPAVFALLVMKSVLHDVGFGASRWAELGRLVICGLTLVGVLLPTSLFLVYRDDPHVELPARLERFVGALGSVGRRATLDVMRKAGKG